MAQRVSAGLRPPMKTSPGGATEPLPVRPPKPDPIHRSLYAEGVQAISPGCAATPGTPFVWDESTPAGVAAFHRFAPRAASDPDGFLTPASLKTQRHQDRHGMKSALRPTSSASPRLCASHSLASPSPSRSSRLLLSPFGLNPGRMAAKITERRKRTRFPSDETAFLQRSHTRQTPPRDRHGMRCLRPKRPPARIPTADTTEPRRKDAEPAPFVAPPRKSASNVNSTGLTPLLSHPGPFTPKAFKPLARGAQRPRELRLFGTNQPRPGLQPSTDSHPGQRRTRTDSSRPLRSRRKDTKTGME